MDDFDDFITPSSGRGPPEGTASHRPAQGRSNNPNAAFDPFASSESLHTMGPGPSTNRRESVPSHVLVDHDDADLLGDEDAFDAPPYSRPTYAHRTSSSKSGAGGYPPSLASFDDLPAMGSSSRNLPYSDAGESSTGLPLSSYGAAPAGASGPFADVYGVETQSAGNFKSIEADDDPDSSYQDGIPYSYGGVNGRGDGRAHRQQQGQPKRKSRPFAMSTGAAGKSRSLPSDGIFDGVKRSYRGVKEDVSGLFRSKAALNKVPQGERIVLLNDPLTNDKEGSFRDNYVSTSKFNVITFVPKFLVEQFSKYANIFFLFTACIQQIPNVSPTNRWTTIVPLGIVLLASAFKEAKEDVKRHQSDAELNGRIAQVLNPASGQFEPRRWRHIRVGDVIRVESNDFFAADLVLLSSSEPEGLCYVETANLDGETNLKIKQASPDTAKLTSPQSVAAVRGQINSEHPNNSLYTFDATLNMQVGNTPGFSGMPSKKVPLGPDQLLLRGAQLRNTPWCYGLVIFTGHETKLMRNATAAPIKTTAVEKMVNVQILLLFIVLLALSIASSIGSIVRTSAFSDEMQYLLLGDDNKGKARVFVEDILTFIIAYNNLIPISLIVTIEVVKYQQATLINSDLDMYYPATDTPALCRTSSLVEELGQIDFIFSDKTGTLTRNEMEFKQASIGGVSYTDVIDESKQGTGEIGPDGREIGGQRTWHELRAIMNGTVPDDGSSGVVDEFLTLLAVCHTVIPERHGETIKYQASSPDEAALVAGAESLDYRFTTRKPRSVFIEVRGVEEEYEVLQVCEFNSTRKRMSTVVRCPDGKIKLYCKGADTVIMARLSDDQPFSEQTLLHLEDYATEGLRTLCVAMREIPEQEYRQWTKIYESAAAQISGRGEALDNAAELIEKNLFLLGATAIEDKLQEGVPETIHTLQNAGIKIWVLTGDRQETAINIGLSCRLISESMNLVIVNEDNAHDTADLLNKRLQAIKNQRSVGEIEELALIIDGKSLTFALEKETSKAFLELALMCKAVICCRVSPLQKALVVKLVKKNHKALLLAIGDGANDVSMIQAAHVGVGISGVEGLQAARSADVAISQFRYLRKLLLVHGSWSYTRLSKMILYSFYKNITLYMTQFWFSFQSSFSGQVPFESWTLSLYNVVFTVLPPLVIGIFDQYLSARVLDRYPQLYGQVFFNRRKFWGWTINAFYHSLVAYIFVTASFWASLQSGTGYTPDLWVWGTTLFISVLATVLGKAALVSDLWTKYTFAAIPGSFIFTLAFLAVYMIAAPAIGFSKEYERLIGAVYGSPLFWFCILLVPGACLSRDYAWKFWQRTWRPESRHIAAEIQKYNLVDHRPRMSEFQKAIRKVRAVQRIRRTRGYAFSGGEQGEEARLIRLYDTTRPKPDGLGE